MARREPKTIGLSSDCSSSKGLVPTCVTTNSEDPTARTLPTIKAFSVQCADCLKWRLIPSKEIYEKIRQAASERPFVCVDASSWNPQASCNDPSEFNKRDTNLIWALDKPDIPITPKGWERLVVFRGQGPTFADVYYKSPTGKRLRSIRDVAEYLEEHPEETKGGINISQFSFVRPKPEGARKRKTQHPKTSANNQ